MFCELTNFEVGEDYKITKRATDDGVRVRIVFGKKHKGINHEWFSEDLVISMDKKQVFKFATDLIKKAKKDR